jgi:nucleotide-binding universal stress UspA family protein
MKILLGVDGSPFSEAATRGVLSRPWPAGTELRVVSVAHPYPFVPDPFLVGAAIHYESLEKERLRAAEDVRRVADEAALQVPELTVTTATYDGSPKDILLAEAERWGADLVVVGSHGRGAAGRFLLGSVSHALALHAPCSVEIVRQRPESQNT